MVLKCLQWRGKTKREEVGYGNNGEKATKTLRNEKNKNTRIHVINKGKNVNAGR